MGRIRIAPSMMCADFLNLKKDIDIFIERGIDYLHIDIMDGHYVPNFTFGVDFCRALASYTSIPLDIHLMVENAERYLADFASFKNSILSFHPDVCYHPFKTIELIKSCGAKAGIALDPSLPLEAIRHLLPEADMVCVMTVNPGYAGQPLVPGSLEKLAEIASYLRERAPEVDVEVDGNVSWENIPGMLEAGAGVLVAGSSSIFERGGDLRKNIVRLRSMIESCSERDKPVKH